MLQVSEVASRLMLVPTNLCVSAHSPLSHFSLNLSIWYKASFTMSNIPIVQGVAVPNERSNYGYHGRGHSRNRITTIGLEIHMSSVRWRGTPPLPANMLRRLRELRQNPVKQYQDVGWAFFSLSPHLAVMIVVLTMGLMTFLEGTVSNGSYGNIILWLGSQEVTAIGYSHSRSFFHDE
jgi:hypothetical protein